MHVKEEKQLKRSSEIRKKQTKTLAIKNHKK